MSVNEYKGVYVFAQQVDNHIDEIVFHSYCKVIANLLVFKQNFFIKFVSNTF